MRSSIGKIARLSADLRQQINLRILNGERSDQILPWLNELPAVKETLAAQFGGAAINHVNLTNWRATGYKRWQAEQKTLTTIKNLGQYGAGISEASGGNVSPGAAVLASGKLLEFLDIATADQTDAGDLLKCATAASRLLRGEQNADHLKLAHKKVRQRDEQLAIARDRDQRDDVQIALRVLGDARAKAIEASDCSNPEKIEMMGRHLFNKLWISRPVPAEPAVSLPQAK